MEYRAGTKSEASEKQRANPVASLLLEWEMNRDVEDQNRTIAETIRRMENVQRARKKRKK